MNKTIPTIILSLFLLSCYENKKERNSTNQDEQKNSLNKIERKDSVFLNFSPNMTDDEFEITINQQPNSYLKDKKFPILIGDQTLNFRVIKNQNAISLKYYSQDLSKEEKNTIPIKKYYNNLISIFEKKYKRYDLDDFVNKPNFEYFSKEYLKNKNNDSLLLQNLIKHNFNKANYKMFRDSLKTLMIGYSFEHDFIGSLINEAKGNKSEIYQYVIEIDYFLTEDFDSIKNDISMDYQQYVFEVNEDELLRKKIKDDDKNKSKRNINKL